jgi:hypothetical protein
MTEAITIQESARLVELEKKIKRGLDTFVEVGEALLEIRDSRLYRIEHATFEDYCREKWGFTRMQASRLINAAEATTNVTNWLQPESPKPTTESQARPLTKLPPEEQPAAWAKAVERADGKQPTAKQVEAAVASIIAPEEDETEADRSVMAACEADCARLSKAIAETEEMQRKSQERFRRALRVRELLERVNVEITLGFEEGDWRDFPGAECSVIGQMEELIERLKNYENAK